MQRAERIFWESLQALLINAKETSQRVCTPIIQRAFEVKWRDQIKLIERGGKF